MKPFQKKFQYGSHEVILETGQIARQADGAVLVNLEFTALYNAGIDGAIQFDTDLSV